MKVFAPAKINLGLRILRKREDGYHDLETVFLAIPWFDEIEVTTNKSDTEDVRFSSSGIPVDGDPSDNLCVKAYRLLKERAKLPPVSIHLHKSIPMGAGLGGGSSDAAAVLKLVNREYSVGLTEGELESVASRLGADCAFFIRGVASLATGIGDKLTPVSLDLSGFWMVIVYPPVHVSTAEAYAGVTPHLPESSLMDILRDPDPRSWRDRLVNDFEKSVFLKYPLIREVKDALYRDGAEYASMSGSGSAVFGIFREEPQLNWPQEYKVWKGKF